MIELLVVWVAGALPILLIAWLGRKAFRTSLTVKSALYSVGAATFLAFFIRNFAEGVGGFDARIAGLFDSQQLLFVVPQGLIALVLAIIAARGLAGGEQ